ncbi:MAG: hypothetical protein AAF799_38700 [Myxococcota bacterium]
MSPCDENRPCATRGQVCDLDALECIDADLDTSSTENPAAGTFTDKVIPFFRGEVCVPAESQSGAPLPVLMRPCLHPCITPASFEFRHTFSCIGSRCEALALTWINGNSNSACPADAFGQFDQAQCQYGTEVEFTIGTTTSNGPIRGSMEIEVPFLTNADMDAIVASPDDATLKSRVEQYPQDGGRLVGPQPVSLLEENAAPPSSCAGGACPCYPIGF